MIDNTVHAIADDPADAVLRDELAHGDALIGTLGPILRHLLTIDDHSVFSEEIVARVNGMMIDVASQLLNELSVAAGGTDDRDHSAQSVASLVRCFVAHPGFLSHAHALALEWQLTERLHTRLALDPVLSPLLQAQIASADPATASHAMALLASQARFTQTQRRMQLPLAELPGDLLHTALLAMRHLSEPDEPAQTCAEQAEAAIRSRFAESRSRLGLISRLVTGMGGGAAAALSVTHAGVGIFLSALALASGQDREMAVLATTEGQRARLTLALRASGLTADAAEEQFLTLHPELSLPAGFERLGSAQAAEMLACSSVFPGN